MDGSVVGAAFNTDLTDPDPEESKAALNACENLQHILLMIGGMEEKVSWMCMREKERFVAHLFVVSLSLSLVSSLSSMGIHSRGSSFILSLLLCGVTASVPASSKN